MLIFFKSFILKNVLNFSAGTETSSILFGHCLWTLSIYPEIQEKARTDTSNTYLKAVLNECLRRYQPVVGVAKKCHEDVVLEHKVIHPKDY